MATDTFTVEIEEMEYDTSDNTAASNDCGACGSCSPD